MDGSGSQHTIVGNLVKWVKDTPVVQALARNQFDLVMALCVEDNMFPSFSPVLGECLTGSINVSDIVDFILWGAWLENTKTTRSLLHATCAVLENYKSTILRAWSTATAGDTAYRAIMFMMKCRGMAIIGDKLKYSLAMSAILSLSKELFGPVSENTSPMFFNTSVVVFDVFPTEVYVPHTIPRLKLYHQDAICSIIGDDDADVSNEVVALHTAVWGSQHYIEPCLDTLKLITKVSEGQNLSNINLKHVYVAGMAMSGLLASHQMMMAAVPDGSIHHGYQYIMKFLEEYVKVRLADNERIMQSRKQEQQDEEEVLPQPYAFEWPWDQLDQTGRNQRDEPQPTEGEDGLNLRKQAPNKQAADQHKPRQKHVSNRSRSLTRTKRSHKLTKLIG